MNAMQQAMMKSGALNGKQFTKVSEDAEKKDKSKGWNASLTYKTYQALKAQGVME